MAIIDSIPPFPHLLYEKSGWRGIPLDILAVRGTFDLGKDGEPMRLAAAQTPLVLGDVYDGPIATDPLSSVLKEDGDLVAGKLGTDVILTGTVHSPDSQPMRDWLVAVQVGTLMKGLRVTGPRRFERGFFGWRMTRPEPATSVPLDYRLAFGGRVSIPCDDGMCALHCATNPAGTGWLPDDDDMKDLPKSTRRTLRAWVKSQRSLMAPQFEDYARPIRDPFERPIPQGFGPIARWWQPRLSYQGTLDDQWLAERYPDPPDDYNPRYLQSAHPELVSAKLLEGDEPVTLGHCLPEGKVYTELPGIAVQALTKFQNGHLSLIPLGLDTVRIDLDRRQCVLVWRTQFDRSNPPVEITISAMALPMWREVLKTKASQVPHG